MARLPCPPTTTFGKSPEPSLIATHNSPGIGTARIVPLDPGHVPGDTRTRRLPSADAIGARNRTQPAFLALFAAILFTIPRAWPARAAAHPEEHRLPLAAASAPAYAITLPLLGVLGPADTKDIERDLDGWAHAIEEGSLNKVLEAFMPPRSQPLQDTWRYYLESCPNNRVTITVTRVAQGSANDCDACVEFNRQDQCRDKKTTSGSLASNAQREDPVACMKKSDGRWRIGRLCSKQGVQSDRCTKDGKELYDAQHPFC